MTPRPAPRSDDDCYDAEALDHEACWDLLRHHVVGRLGVCQAGRPLVLPINYVCDGASIVFRTATGTKLAAAVHQPVSFEIDGYEPALGEAWSVVVDGAAEMIQQPDELAQADSLLLFPWHVAPKAHYVRIVPEEVSGRRFRAPYAGVT